MLRQEMFVASSDTAALEVLCSSVRRAWHKQRLTPTGAIHNEKVCELKTMSHMAYI